MFAVYKREFKAYMTNVYGWLFMAVLLLYVGFMVYLDNLRVSVPFLEYALIDSDYALILLIPVLCMRSMAEDRRNKTDMFYLSLPIKTSAVVLGKYFALLTVYALPCAVIAVYPFILSMFGTVNFAGAYSSILYFLLLGAALIAICQFLSGLTENLVVAAVLGVLACLVVYALPLLGVILPEAPVVSFAGFLLFAALAALIAYLATRSLTVTVITAAVLVIPLSLCYILAAPGFEGLLPAVLEWVSPFIHFEEASSFGWFHIPSAILCLSYPVFFVYLTVCSADKKRWA